MMTDGRSMARMSDKALEARSQVAQDEMRDAIEDNCANMSVLYQKYAKTCKRLFEEGPARFAEKIEALKK
jgi:hypothetical protein